MKPMTICPQPCIHLSQQDAQEGRVCAIHPCTCQKARRTRLEDQRADIIGWFTSHSSDAIRTVIDAGESIITERANDGVTA